MATDLHGTDLNRDAMVRQGQKIDDLQSKGKAKKGKEWYCEAKDQPSWETTGQARQRICKEKRGAAKEKRGKAPNREERLRLRSEPTRKEQQW